MSKWLVQPPGAILSYLILTISARKTNLNLIPRHAYGLTESYGPLTVCYELPEWDSLPIKEKFAKLARQGHGFITSLPARVIKTSSEDDERDYSNVLVDVNKDGKEIGEIVFFGNICAKGYHKDPEATKKLFAGGGLRTGDLAVWHPDGSIQIQDRAKDIIISGRYPTHYLAARNTDETGGENISSVALESLLAEHPSILEAAVVAIPDEQWGERPKAYVTGRNASSPPDPAAVIAWAREQGKTFMVPKEVEVLKELPKTSTGKIRKNVLREWAKGKSA